MGRTGERLRTLVFGADGRVRATWRVLLAFPFLWVLTGAVLTGNINAALGLSGLAHNFAQSALHAVFVLLALWVWARYLEDASLWDYGISATPQWALECLVGYLAFVGAILIWAGIGVATGTATVSTGPPSDGLGIIVISVVSLALHAAVQQVVFFRVILGSALEGLYARELAQPLVIGISVIVAAILFWVMHQVPGGLRLLDLVIAGACFSLFYLHTGDLALGIGVQTGALLSGGPLLAWFTVEKSFPGLLGTIHGYGFPTVIMAYGLILGWLWCRTESAGQDWFEGRPGATRSS